MAKNNKRNIIVALVVLIGIAAIVVLILALTGVFGGKDTDAEDEQSTASSSTLVCIMSSRDAYKYYGTERGDIDLLGFEIKNTYYFDDTDTVTKFDSIQTMTTKSHDDALAVAEAYKNGTSTLRPFNWSASGHDVIGVLIGGTVDLEFFKDMVGSSTSRAEIKNRHMSNNSDDDYDYTVSCN